MIFGDVFPPNSLPSMSAGDPLIEHYDQHLMNAGQIQIPPEPVLPWRFNYASKAYLLEELLCHNINWKFDLIHCTIEHCWKEPGENWQRNNALLSRLYHLINRQCYLHILPPSHEYPLRNAGQCRVLSLCWWRILDLDPCRSAQGQSPHFIES